MIVDVNCQFLGRDEVKPLLGRMDAAGIDKTLLSAALEASLLRGRKEALRGVGNSEVASAVRFHPDRLIGCMLINPLDPGAIDTVSEYSEKGFKAVKFVPAQGYYPDDPRFYELFDSIQERNLAALFSMGQINFTLAHEKGARRALNSAFAYPMRLDAPSRLFPGIRFVIIHMGFPFLFEAWSVHHANKNVFLEISGSGAYFDALPVAYAAVGGSSFIPLDFGKVVWGSDNVENPAAHLLVADSHLRMMGCADSERRKKVFGENAARILGITR
jgi:predicted TIM-barrel fold metal-dependent hydrolase